MTSHTSFHGSRARAGFTLVEVIATLLIMGILLSLAAPVMQRMVDGFRTESAVEQLVNDLAYTRSLALKNGRSASFRATGGTSYALTVDTSTTSTALASQKQVRAVNLTSETRVTISPTTAVITFDSRGFGRTAPDTVVVRRGNAIDTVYIEPFGRIRRAY